MRHSSMSSTSHSASSALRTSRRAEKRYMNSDINLDFGLLDDLLPRFDLAPTSRG